MTPEEIAEREELQRMKLYRDANEKYKGYVPNLKAEEFIKKTFSGKYKITLFSAANGVGKTTVAVNTLAELMWPSGNPFFDLPLIRDWPYAKRIRIVSESQLVQTSIIEEMKKWFPKGRYTTDKKGRPFEAEWRTDTGWMIDVMTYDQSPSKFEGANIGLIWCDEPPPSSIHKANVSRLRNGGLLFITATPLTGSAWMYDAIVANEDNDAGFRTFVEATVWDACCDYPDDPDNERRGHLKIEEIDKMIAQYSEDDKQARILGKFQHLTGLVFKQWKRDVHVIRPFQIDHENWTVYEAIDPHPRNPDAVVWIAVDPDGTKIVIDELYLKCEGGVEELAQRIKEKGSQYRIERRIGDPSMFIEDQHTQKSLAQRLAGFGLSYLPATKARQASDRRIADALNYQTIGEEFIRTPEMYVFDTCKRTIFEMEHYQWDEWSGRTGDDRDPKQKPKDKDDHAIECIGRLLFQEPEWTPPAPPPVPYWAQRDELSEAPDVAFD